MSLVVSHSAGFYEVQKKALQPRSHSRDCQLLARESPGLTIKSFVAFGLLY